MRLEAKGVSRPLTLAREIRYGHRSAETGAKAAPFPSTRADSSRDSVKKLNPPADHGEASYVGTEKLRGRGAIVTGADPGIGRAVAIAFAKEGADVLLNYLPEEEPDAVEVVGVIERRPGAKQFMTSRRHSQARILSGARRCCAERVWKTGRCSE